MDKLKMAHDWAMKSFSTDGFKDEAERATCAWRYADAMQAEADERINKERPDVLLTKDKDGNCLHFHHEFGHKKCMDCGASLEEWQPDWSQAPKGATGWSMRSDGVATWHFNYGSLVIGAPSFNYKGNWQVSLRKRPNDL